MTFRAFAITTLAVLVVGGCASVGRDFPTHPVDQITLDETTRAQIQEMFGDPWRTGIEDGERTWTCGKYCWPFLPGACL